MTIGIWVLGDQLWTEQSALHSCQQNHQNTPVILIESLSYVQQRRYHRQKLVFIWSAMRHFAEELRQQGWPVSYKTADDFETPLQAWVTKNTITELRVMTPNDRPFAQMIGNLKLNCQIIFIPNNHFLWSESDFKTWAKSQKRLIMENFYRVGRKRFNSLMAGNKPIGGKWNFDKQNRKPPKRNLNPPDALWFEPDPITQEVINSVNAQNFPTYGKTEPFRWAVNRHQALQVLDFFIHHRLPNFGPYQDAMVTNEDTMWHSLISPYLNIGLLQPEEVIKAVENAYHQNQLDLSSTEGFIRQVLGWREYMHGIYIYMNPDYSQSNWFNHTQPLPDFYWHAEKTDMNCLRQILSQLERTGYSHHIQRLMVLSNFALIVGVSPQAIEQWFHGAFIDGHDWVMQTNVIGMGQFADGGILASKPYAASANYINKMSDYCSSCAYNPRKRTGPGACPFNFLYWDFLCRHRDQLKAQGRMSLVLSHIDRISDQDIQQIREEALRWHSDNIPEHTT
ncbi:MAG: cryptochrome/photolyase family protein [Moorea sp. SIO1G6]|uniref:cryptochrome/photolyase family protein n=1 Tax=Moorena sp. SIO1G6 TaxID=2607840 RepID=UPI0013C234CD|nr:cryptochrome/photolyase family protein [Moorena sp. SIO1G6]NES84686.1 cryptochrome/photolyase family protein [Moorena sp. SIO2B7]NET67688.1 cryptochrome/photolyase family protein [Moorena sp. SIO1G6]